MGNPGYMLFIGPGILLGLWASFKVKSTFAKYSQLGTQSGYTGADVARRILEDNNIHGVSVEPVAGSMTDHYDPRSKTLRLSDAVYGGSSMAALGVAAHEVGHALQHATSYAPLAFRSAWVPVASTGNGISIFVLIAALFMGGMATAFGSVVAILGLGLFATATVFTLITLPVEFDASKRALACLKSGGYVTAEELKGARKVLDAAAMTYVAAFVTSLLTLLYWAHALGLFGRRR